MERSGILMEEIRSVLDSRTIRINLDAKNKKDAITQLSQTLADANYIDDVPSFVKDIYVREAEGITGIGDGIAIPHGKSDYVTNVGVAIGLLKRGIEWESLDEQPISIVILFAVSNDVDAAKNQLKLLSLFAGRLGHKTVIQNLQQANTIEEVISAFSKKEGTAT